MRSIVTIVRILSKFDECRNSLSKSGDDYNTKTLYFEKIYSYKNNSERKYIR